MNRWPDVVTPAMHRQVQAALLTRRRMEAGTLSRDKRPPAIVDLAARLESSFRAFIRSAWSVLEPGPLCDEWYLDAISDHLEAVHTGQIRNLWIHIRPRMLKTTVCSIMYDAWTWAKDPTRRVLSSSFSDDRRKDDARRTRFLIESEWYRQLWPKVVLEGDQNEKHRYSLTAGGHRYTSIYGSGATGDGGHLLRLDDPQCAADMHSRIELERDHDWFYSTWERRADEPGVTPHVGIMQRLGPFDLPNMLRVDEPGRWEVLSLESRRASILVAPYYRRSEDDRVEIVHLPRTDTALLRSGAFIDPRQPGDLLSTRVLRSSLVELERNRPSEYAAQEDQAPLLLTSEGARIHRFDRTRHIRSFAARMGCTTLADAITKAMREGWQITTGWDHGQAAGRECAMILIWSDRLQECWVIGEYLNPRRTVPREDALAVRRLLDARGISIRAVVRSLGDVGNLGKGTTESENVARTINQELSTCRFDDAHPILGFPISTPRKEAGSVDRGVELLNMGFDSGGLFIDECCTELPIAIELWNGGEPYKDPCDGLRYPARPILEGWLHRRPGASGVVSG